jgi:AbrB family looped-hinge helix DNA binding protein
MVHDSFLRLLLHSEVDNCLDYHKIRGHDNLEEIKMTTSTSFDADVNIKTYSVRLRNQGQITMPKAVRESLAIADGDILALLQIGDLILLIPKQLRVPQLADKIATLMEQEGVSLNDLLSSLAEEREGNSWLRS